MFSVAHSLSDCGGGLAIVMLVVVVAQAGIEKSKVNSDTLSELHP